MRFLRLALIIGPLPVTLTNGTTADATQVMADLNWIVNQVNANSASTVNQAVTNANNNFTTVQSGQAATQPANFVTALQIQNNSLQTLSSVLGTNSITARLSAVSLGTYVSGQVFTFVPSNQNTGATTLNIDGLGARSILSMGSALSGAELQNYNAAFVLFNGNQNAFDLLNATPYVKGPNIAATGTLNLDGTPGDYNQVDGIATITAMTLSPGRQKLLEFTSSPQITNGASLILGSNVTPATGDVWGFRGEPGGVVRATSMLVSGPRYLYSALGSDVLLNNTATTFDGPTVSQPAGMGIWFVSGTVSINATNPPGNYIVTLWDGANVIASTSVTGQINIRISVTLSGLIQSPAGNIRMSVRDTTATGNSISFNASGKGKDSTVTVLRIA